MKKILLLCLVCVAVAAKAQKTIKLPLKDSAVVYESTVEATGATDKLFTQAQNWINDTFKDSKSFLSVNDKDNLKLVGKGFIVFLPGNNDPDTYLTYNIDITIKNGAYSYKIYDIGALYGTSATPLNKAYSKYLHGEIHKNSLIESKRTAKIRLEDQFVFTDQSITSLVISLKQAMSGTN
jgi:hypothetical protein